MTMPATLFAIRSSWVALFLVLVGLFVAWFLIRALIDFVKWFKEEIVDDIREQREKSKKRRQANRRAENGERDRPE